MQSYPDAWTWAQDEERHALLLLHRFLLKRRARRLTETTPLDGLAGLDGLQLADFFASASQDVLAANGLDGSIAVLRDTINARLAATTAAGRELPIARVARLFRLDAAARALLHLLAACHLSAVVREYVHAATGTRWLPWPRGEGLAELIASSRSEGAALLGALAPEAPLVRCRLLERGPDPDGWTGNRPLPVSARTYVLAQRVRALLDGHTTDLDDGLARCASRLEATATLSELHLDDPQRDALAAVLPAEGDTGADRPSPRLWFIGPRGSEVKPLLCAVSASLGRAVLMVEVDLWLQRGQGPVPDPGELVREAVLGGTTLTLDFSGLDDHQLLDRDTQSRTLQLIERLEADADAFGFPLFLHTFRTLKFLRLYASHIEPFECGFPSPERRRQLWTRELERNHLQPEPDTLQRVSDAFVLTEDDIQRVARTVQRQLAARMEDTADAATLLEACRDDMDIRLQGLTRRIHRPWTLDDIVLQQPQREIVEEIIAYASFRADLFEVWGFSRHYVTGRGVHCLFSGPPGTGKTMAASVIANALKLPLYRIELSQIVDRYVGETEKRLQQIFDEASRAPCAILFDEADSLFAKRTEVKSSNDRYANLEVNYLLQRLEEFDGVTFLTTNLPGSLDEAFIRRIPFQIAFPEPDHTLTEQLWQHLIPAEVELHPDIDFTYLAESFEMTGGHIKNVILRATLKAMREDRHHLTQDDLIHAALVEYTKLGRLPPQEFR